MAQRLAGHDIEELNVSVQVVQRVFLALTRVRCLLRCHDRVQLMGRALDIVGDIDTHTHRSH